MSFASRWWATGQNRGIEVLSRPRVRQRTQVVDERVRPHVRDLVGVPRDRDPPRLTGPADREVLQAARDERPGLVGPEAGKHEVRPLVVERQQPLLVGGQPEEPVALLDPLGLDVVLGALAVDELVLRLERLAADAVQAGVDVLVDVLAAVVADPLQELLDEALVPVVARADEEVVGHAEAGGERPPRLHDAVGVLLWREALFLGDPSHLRRMLVDTGEKERLTAALPLMACEDVRGHGRVGVADVRRRVDVVDRRRDVVRLHQGRFYGPPTCRLPPRSAPGGPRRRPLGAGADRSFRPGGSRCARSRERLLVRRRDRSRRPFSADRRPRWEGTGLELIWGSTCAVPPSGLGRRAPGVVGARPCPGPGRRGDGVRSRRGRGRLFSTDSGATTAGDATASPTRPRRLRLPRCLHGDLAPVFHVHGVATSPWRAWTVSEPATTVGTAPTGSGAPAASRSSAVELRPPWQRAWVIPGAEGSTAAAGPQAPGPPRPRRETPRAAAWPPPPSSPGVRAPTPGRGRRGRRGSRAGRRWRWWGRWQGPARDRRGHRRRRLAAAREPGPGATGADRAGRHTPPTPTRPGCRGERSARMLGLPARSPWSRQVNPR